VKQRYPDHRRSSDIRLISIRMENRRLSPSKVRGNVGVRDRPFVAAYNHPELIPVTAERNESSAEHLAAETKAFALSHEADAIGIAPMDPLYVFEGIRSASPG
jgi:hypothetical protein